jgi:hypothetical protein
MQFGAKYEKSENSDGAEKDQEAGEEGCEETR